MEKLNCLYDKRDKLTSRLFKAKLQQLLSGCEVSLREQKYGAQINIYNNDVHEYLWRPASNYELKKSFNLQKENLNIDSICFTVGVFELNNQAHTKKFKNMINLSSEGKTFKAISTKCIMYCKNCEQLVPSSIFKSQNCSNRDNILMDVHGKLKCQHKADSLFDLIDFVQFLNNRKKLKWRDIFW